MSKMSDYNERMKALQAKADAYFASQNAQRDAYSARSVDAGTAFIMSNPIRGTVHVYTVDDQGSTVAVQNPNVISVMLQNERLRAEFQNALDSMERN